MHAYMAVLSSVGRYTESTGYQGIELKSIPFHFCKSRNTVIGMIR